MAKTGHAVGMFRAPEMSGIRERLKELNEVESTEDRLLAAYAKLPRRMQCKYVAVDGTLCQRRRVGKSWCPECRQRVAADPKRKGNVT
jgi:hypothetical protein